FSSRRRHTRSKRDWSSDVCSSDLGTGCAAHLCNYPAVSDFVVLHDGIAALIRRTARCAQRSPEGTEGLGSGHQGAAFAVNGVLEIDGLHNMVRAHCDVCIRRRKTGRAYSIKGRAREGFDSRFGMALPRVIVSILAVIAVRQTMMRMFGGRMLLLVVGKVNDAGRD